MYMDIRKYMYMNIYIYTCTYPYIYLYITCICMYVSICFHTICTRKPCLPGGRPRIRPDIDVPAAASMLKAYTHHQVSVCLGFANPALSAHSVCKVLLLCLKCCCFYTYPKTRHFRKSCRIAPHHGGGHACYFTRGVFLETDRALDGRRIRALHLAHSGHFSNL